MVNFRLVALGRRPHVRLPALEGGKGAAAPAKHRPVYFDDPGKPIDCPIYLRDALGPGGHMDGPALIQEYASTTLIFEGDACTVAETGELIISLRSA
ncbi:MAG: hypothetical protein IIB16_06695 [Chloroflexi bacterium]|nr:hypothetical protein [Chloroflexota bacterium]